MESTLSYITITDFRTSLGERLSLTLSYEVFGRPLGEAPVVLITHALTGNSAVAGEKGWWNKVVSKGGAIDLDRYTALCFNMPGNGYDKIEESLPLKILLADIAGLFLAALSILKITHLRALIGGSIGGSLGWEMLAKSPKLTEIFIPIACDYRTTDWLFSQCLIQKYLLSHPIEPLQKARAHAMLCYRTPESLNARFQGEIASNSGVRRSQEWIEFHGKKLNERFSLRAYRFMNHLLTTINVKKESLREIEAKIYFIAIDSDLFFPGKEMKDCYELLHANQKEVDYFEIKSVHGHDAFLIEYPQLNTLINKALK